MSTIFWGIRVDITDTTTSTYLNIGLQSGYLNWITGKPGYVGSGYSGEAPSGVTWVEGRIADDLSPMVRMTKNMETTGGYGGLSGFSFTLNDTIGINNILESNNYHIINRPIDVYCFLDDVSYHVWGGVVSKKVKTNVKLKISCEDDFQNAHKQIPPNIITKEIYPDVYDDNIGRSIPLVFGNVFRSELINILGRSSSVSLGAYYEGSERHYSDITYCNSPLGTPLETPGGDLLLRITTPYMNFAEDYFINSGVYYVNVIKGSSQGQNVKIIGSEETELPGTAGSSTQLQLENGFDSVTVDEFNAIDGTGAAKLFDEDISSKVWFFKVMYMKSVSLISNNTISQIPLDSSNSPVISIYNNNYNKYEDVKEIFMGAEITSSNNYNHPYIKVMDSRVDVEGDFKILSNIKPTSITFINAYALNGTITVNTTETDMNNLIDGDPLTYVQLSATSANEVRLEYRLSLPTDNVIDGFEDLYLLPRYTFQSSGSITMSTLITGIGPFRNYEFSDNTDNESPPGGLSLVRNMLPSSYFNPQIASQFGLYSNVEELFYNELYKINSGLVSSYNDGLASNSFNIRITLNTESHENWIVQMTQLGFTASKTMNVDDNKIYIKAKGETV